MIVTTVLLLVFLLTVVITI